MRKSLILFTIVFAYIWGCSSSEDKYDLIANDEREAIGAMCKCLEPLSPYLEQMVHSSDSLKTVMYADTFATKLLEYAPCLEKAEKLEAKFGGSKEYTKQFMEYIKEKHPKCMAFWLGESVKDSSKIEVPDSTKNNKK